MFQSTTSTSDCPWATEAPFDGSTAQRESRSEPVSSVESVGESPFRAQYDYVGAGLVDPRAEQFASLVSELEDREFEESVTDLVNEAAAIAEQYLQSTDEEPERAHDAAENTVREYLRPLEREANAVLDKMGETLVKAHASTAEEVDAALQSFEFESATQEPVFHAFLGGLAKKAKKLAQKAVSMAGKILPTNMIMEKLKPLVRPMIERVLRMAVDKLPEAMREPARLLAARFLGSTLEGVAQASESSVEATADPGAIQRELDARLAGYLVEGEAFEREVGDVLNRANDQPETSNAIRDLDQARTRFATQIVSLSKGEDPTPVIQQFLPAILAAARIAIRLIGRERVVDALASMVAQLIAKFVGQEAAKSLSRALVSTGLNLVGLEAPNDAPILAGYTLASTIEETVNRLATEAPPSAWEDRAVLEYYTCQAFNRAAASNFPDAQLRPELHEAKAINGAWVLHPIERPLKRYKKYSVIPEINITAQIAESVKTFGGTPLSSVLRTQLGLDLTKGVPAKVHLYEAIPGTTLARIAHHEKRTPGLGHGRRYAWSLIHPLTPEAATALLQEPGLGVVVDGRFLERRGVPAVGQRFYYLDFGTLSRRRYRRMQDSAVRCRSTAVQPDPKLARLSETNVSFDFPASELKVYAYYSEDDAQRLARFRPVQLKNAIVASAADGLLHCLNGITRAHIKIVHEQMANEGKLPDAAMPFFRAHRGMVAKTFREWIAALLGQRATGLATEWQRAADADADGLTLKISLKNTALLSGLRKMVIDSGSATAVSELLKGVRLTDCVLASEIVPGFTAP